MRVSNTLIASQTKPDIAAAQGQPCRSLGPVWSPFPLTGKCGSFHASGQQEFCWALLVFPGIMKITDRITSSAAFNVHRTRNKKPQQGFDELRLLKGWKTPCNPVKEL